MASEKQIVTTKLTGRNTDCPHCGRNLNAASIASENPRAAPSQGDFSVCFYCRTFLRFGADRYELGTEAEYKTVEPATREFAERFLKAIHIRKVE